MNHRPCIFITGAASGIGRSTALLFAERGWTVGLGDIDTARLSKLVQQAGRAEIVPLQMDVRDRESVQQAVTAFSETTGGRMDVLFNCAGILPMGPFALADIFSQEETIRVNVVGILNCIHTALGILRQTPQARIINMSSASAIYGVPELAVYSASKFAVRGLTEALNIELESCGIHVCDITAPYVRTPMITRAAVKATSIGRLGVRLTPEQVARVVWKAAHGSRVHWNVSGLLRLLLFIFWAFPFARRPIVRALAYRPPT